MMMTTRFNSSAIVLFILLITGFSQDAKALIACDIQVNLQEVTCFSDSGDSPDLYTYEFAIGGWGTSFYVDASALGLPDSSLHAYGETITLGPFPFDLEGTIIVSDSSESACQIPIFISAPDDCNNCTPTYNYVELIENEVYEACLNFCLLDMTTAELASYETYGTGSVEMGAGFCFTFTPEVGIYEEARISFYAFDAENNTTNVDFWLEIKPACLYEEHHLYTNENEALLFAPQDLCPIHPLYDLVEIGDATNGTVFVIADDSLVYTPNDNFTGLETFYLHYSDPLADCVSIAACADTLFVVVHVGESECLSVIDVVFDNPTPDAYEFCVDYCELGDDASTVEWTTDDTDNIDIIGDNCFINLFDGVEENSLVSTGEDEAGNQQTVTYNFSYQNNCVDTFYIDIPAGFSETICTDFCDLQSGTLTSINPDIEGSTTEIGGNCFEFFAPIDFNGSTQIVVNGIDPDSNEQEIVYLVEVYIPIEPCPNDTIFNTYFDSFFSATLCPQFCNLPEDDFTIAAVSNLGPLELEFSYEINGNCFDVILPDNFNSDFQLEVIACNDDLGICDTMLYVFIWEAPEICANDCVWPGDTDKDGVVDVSDVLYLGLAYNEDGPTRNYPDPTLWIAQSAENWNATFENGIDYKNADCDGNGVINGEDVDVIELNYGYEIGKTSADGDFDFDLNILNEPIMEGDSVEVIVSFDDSPVFDLSGITAKFTYNSEYLVPGSFSFDYFNGPFGDPENSISLSVELEETGEFHFGGSRIDGSSITNEGPIGVLQFVVIDNINGKQQVDLNLSAWGIGLTTDQEKLEVGSQGASTTINTGINAANNIAVNCWPIPATDFLMVESDESQRIASLEIISVSGQTLKREKPLSNNSRIDVSELTEGIYFVQLTFEDGQSSTTKFIK